MTVDKFLPTLTLVLLLSSLTVLPAVIHGHYSNRWGEEFDLSQAAKRLQEFPAVIAEWEMSAEGERLREDVVHELGLAGYLTRDYRNRRTGQVVGLLLMVGQPGPLVRHPPDICYANRANVPIGNPELLVVDDAQSESRLRVLHYRRRSPIVTTFCVAYGHTTDGAWDAPKWPRLEYGAEPVLYKVQILYSEQLDSSQEEIAGAVQDFARVFVKTFRQHLDHDDGNPS